MPRFLNPLLPVLGALPLLVLAIALTIAAPAYAQTAAASQISLGPVLTGTVLPILQAILLALASWGATMIAARFHLTVSSAFQAMVDKAIADGVAYAGTKLGAATLTGPAGVAEVVSYVSALVPTALKWLGVTPDSLAKMVTAKLPS